MLYNLSSEEYFLNLKNILTKIKGRKTKSCFRIIKRKKSL